MADTLDFLLEVGTEEMPSAPLIHAIKQFGELVRAGLDEAGLEHGEVTPMSTPRRLTVLVKDVATSTKEVHEVKRGPAANIAFDADGNPTKAAAGFARKFGLDATELVRRQDADGREYVFAEKNVPSRPAVPILTELSQNSIASLEWPNYRSQRWGSEHATFVRPIRWICALLGEEIVPVAYADVTSSNVTRGHRVLGPGEHVVKDPASYVDVCRKAGVLFEDERRKVIRDGIAQVEAERGGAHVDTPKRIFDEVVNLTEYPTVLVGKFDEEFLNVPNEIICDSMLSNQRYFPVYDAKGALTREFVVVSNSARRNNVRVIDGNERVVRARLDDAKFFYEEDLKRPLEDYVQKLKDVVFQEKLGTVYQKALRMQEVAPEVATQAGCDDTTVSNAARAALLAKADLVTQAVVEFTSQQGVMGGYYAKASGEPEEVAEAIRDHYRPRFAGDELPSGIVGKCVAIADKLDTVCGIFAIDEPPTGSSDPFAVRRSAIGIISMLRTLPAVSLKSLIAKSLDAYAGQGLEFDRDKVQAQVEKFFAGRLNTIAKDEKISPDTIEAVSSVGVIDPEEFLERAHALEDARRDQPELFDDLATAYARAAHLGDAKLGVEVDESIMGDAERALLDACQKGSENVEKALGKADYRGACKALAELREPIDRFFDDVLVMDEDTVVRENRLRLLNRFASVFSGVANIGVLSKKK
ncbi:glycine--tRNA ligase subunit beta [Parafannyhessea umbonata]|uniref:Glycine--tRNA ligase beta subunit n=2 Tax=Parafannyhessea umbonata TaxID=604330 RepID=A0A6N7XC22_9ACTN|nr:glycine--tRNA ligase subunit beta [Parafannyhessea umbonata]MDD6566471.1 glycine--tRNA ligase subunit beta [Parafannyhessea umbonata]MST61083.1 glycine--tRNA ligase subunit beta [Parafannyhessea umbonata]